jgi:hypothetical protein
MTIMVMDKISIIYSECVSVALVVWNTMDVPYCHL